MSYHELAARANAHYVRPEDRTEWCDRHEVETEWGVECPECATGWCCEDHGGWFDADEKCPACREEERADYLYDLMKDERAERGK